MSKSSSRVVRYRGPCFKILDTTHTSTNILEAINGLIKGCLKVADIVIRGCCMVTDSQVNVVKDVEDGGFESTCCMTHISLSWIRNALGGKEGGKADLQHAIRELTEAGRRIMGHFNRIIKESKLVREKEKDVYVSTA